MSKDKLKIDNNNNVDNNIDNNVKENTDNEQRALYPKKKKKMNYYKVLGFLFAIGFIVFTALFINEVFITPYRINKSIERTKDYYIKPDSAGTPSNPTQTATVTISPEATPVPVIPDPNRDDQGRLLQFQELLNVNNDVKGWISIPNTNIDYVVMQSSNEDPEYYLTRDIDKQELKAGSLFLDYKSSIEKETQNFVIHGHNMTSTDNMFHYLLNFKKLDYYKERPLFTFDTIYQPGQWKIFAIFVSNGTTKKEPLFNYTRSSFKDSSDFMNFVYQLRIRSIFNINDVDVNENDQLLTLSTCSYEVKDYRTVIVARKVREGEDTAVDVDRVIENPAPLYPGTWYYRFGGKAPVLTETFEEALGNGEIGWYTPVEGE